MTTVVSIDPVSGPTKGGNLVSITGTDFRLPPVPPPGYQGGSQQKTVSVQFEGVESPWAYAASSERILAKVPEWSGPYDMVFPVELDVRVANLDDSGIEIPGESATLVEAYSIYRPELAGETYLQRVIRELVKLFRRHLLENTHISATKVYTDDPSTLERLKEVAPVIHLSGPRTPENRFYSAQVLDEEEDSLDPEYLSRQEIPITVDLEFGIRVWTNGESSARHLIGLHQALLLMFREIQYLKVDNDPEVPDSGYREYELELDWRTLPEEDMDTNDSDLKNFQAACIIRGIHIDTETGTVIERGRIVTTNDGEPTVDVQLATP